MLTQRLVRMNIVAIVLYWYSDLETWVFCKTLIATIFEISFNPFTRSIPIIIPEADDPNI